MLDSPRDAEYFLHGNHPELPFVSIGSDQKLENP